MSGMDPEERETRLAAGLAIKQRANQISETPSEYLDQVNEIAEGLLAQSQAEGQDEEV